MEDVITLSSDEEDRAATSKKRIKPTLVEEPRAKRAKTSNSELYIVLSDDEHCKKSPKSEHHQVNSVQTEAYENGNEAESDCLLIMTEKVVDYDKEGDLKSEQFEAFLDDCQQAIKKPKHKNALQLKLPIVKKLYEKVVDCDVDMDGFFNLLESNRQRTSVSPEKAIVYFSDVYQWLKTAYKDVIESKKADHKTEKHTRKLEKTLYKIQKKICKLEQAEVNWDDEEDSSYIQMSKFEERAKQIYDALCKYQKRNPYHNRIIYKRLDFSASKYDPINQIINKKFRGNAIFPTYYDFDILIRKTVRDSNITIFEADLKTEVRRCFELLGHQLQTRRKLDTYQIHMDYLKGKGAVDPAKDDPQIEEKLQANNQVGSHKLDEVFEKYTQLQEKGIDPSVSSDSDDSGAANSISDGGHDENVADNV